MERRLPTFIVASTAFILVYIWARTQFAPPPPPVEPELAEKAAEVVVDEPNVGPNVGPDVESAVESDASEDSSSEPDAAPSDRPTQPEWLTLGSMDPESGYFMLVTLNSRGGGIERIELTTRNDKGDLSYRRIDVRYGYLGYFAGESLTDMDGVRVNVVGPGTPAATAGIKVGDVIASIAGDPITVREDIAKALETTKPGDTVSVEVIRDGATNPLSLQATLTEHPLDLVRLAKDGGADQVLGNESRLSSLLTLSQVNRKGLETNQRTLQGMVDPMKLNWKVEMPSSESGQSAEFSLELSDAEMKPVGGKSVRLNRSYTLRPGTYAIDLTIQLDNLSDEPQDLAYRLEGANGVTMEGWWYSNKISPHWRGGAAARDVVCNTAAAGHRLLSGYTLLSLAKDRENETDDANDTIFASDSSVAERTMQYIGVDAQYFNVAYVPPEGQQAFTTFRRASAGIAAFAQEIPRHQERAVNTTFYLDSVVAEVPAGGSMRQDMRMFAGPKKPDILAPYGLGDCIYYGWFSLFAKILASLLHVLSAVGNYAVAIILLTVVVRGCMFPLSRKAAVNAQKMQELAPEIKKINEKFKDDMEGKLKAQRELQARVGFNPLAGCLPMFLQLPIFMGLYRALSVDIELRQAAFSSWTDWASNLAGPDMLYYWGEWMPTWFSGRGTGWFGPYFNILPMIVVVLFLAQQKMFMPPPTDEQTAMTAKMMNVMTLMMGVFFFKVPAGLCIYFITSSLWGICERILVKKTLPSGKHFDPSLLDGSNDGSGPVENSQSIVDRIKSQVAKPEPPVERPNKRRRPPKKK